MVILGAPIGDYLFCANFIASKRLDAVKLLSKLVEVAILLRVCESFCKLVHLARATPPSVISDPLQLFANDVRQCFIALYWKPLTPHGSRFNSVYAMVALACGPFLTILVQHLLLLCAPLALVTEIISILCR